MTNPQWPEQPAERQARKVRMHKMKTARRALPAIDTRSPNPNGVKLPY